MQLYEKRDELRAKTQSSAHLSISGALKEIAAPQEEEKPDPEKKELTDEQVAELIREYMKYVGPSNLTDAERAALERRLANPGEAEKELLRDIRYEELFLMMAAAGDGGFFLVMGDNDTPMMEYRSEDKKELYREPLPTTREDLRDLIHRGCPHHAVTNFNVWRRLTDWFVRVLIAEISDLDQVEQRIVNNADWRKADPAGEFLRECLVPEKDLTVKKWALENGVNPEDVEEPLEGVRAWVGLDAYHLEKAMMRAEVGDAA